MLTRYSPTFAEKILISPTGERLRVIFLVSWVDGEARGRVVSVQPLGKAFTSNEEVLSLPIPYSKNVTITEYIPATAPIVSPFAELYFFVSQPTRAPSHK